MVSDLKARRPSLNETLQMRRQAHDLLDRLQADRAFTEHRLAETGKRDPMRAVTGQTALDRAIASAKDMITHIDGVLTQMGHRERVSNEEELPVLQFPTRRVLKPQVRHPARLNPIPIPVITMPAGAVAAR